MWSGPGKPPREVGAEGDFWIDTEEWVIFGPREAEVWPEKYVSIVGPVGATGATGPAGRAGPASQRCSAFDGTNLWVVNRGSDNVSKVVPSVGDVYLRSMRIRYQVVAFDAADLEPESTFWAGVLGGEVDRDDGWHMVMVDGEPRIGVQLAPNHVPPDWPDGSPPQQVHLDLWVDDFAAAHERVMALGARVLRPARGATEGDDFQVYADPAGHPFCLCFLVGGAGLPTG